MGLDANAPRDAGAGPEPTPPIARPSLPDPRRLFLYEPAWRIGLKAGSDREFCYMMAPGQDFYHRLLGGEVYLTNGEEKLCVACATRRGLFSYEPRTLRGSINRPIFDLEPPGAGLA